jgi:hypothetical protein
MIGGVIGTLVLILFSAARTTRFERLRRLSLVVLAYRHRLGLLLGTTALSLIVQTANVLVVWFIGTAMRMPIPGSYYWVLVPTVTVLTLLPISLNGMGIREGSTALFLAPVGIPSGDALCLAFLWFLVFAAASLIGGGVYLIGGFSRPEVMTDELISDHSDQRRAGQPAAAA